jgi:hypothetical protein
VKRLISKDPEFGISQYYVSDPMEGKFRFETVQDCTPILEGAKAQYNSTDERAKWGEWAKVATIPLSIFHNLKRTGVADDKRKFSRWINDPDNRLFRTRPGKV